MHHDSPAFDSSVGGSRKFVSFRATDFPFEVSGSGSSFERMEEAQVTQARSVPKDGTNSDRKDGI